MLACVWEMSIINVRDEIYSHMCLQCLINLLNMEKPILRNIKLNVFFTSAKETRKYGLIFLGVGLIKTTTKR